jgi:hypothetical protein
MAEESETEPWFSGDKDDFCTWYHQARKFATRYGFISTMGSRAVVNLPTAEGPGVGADQQAAVERNMQAAAFIILNMPDCEIINVMMAGISSADWPTQPKAHLMMMYLKETFNVKIEKHDPVDTGTNDHMTWQNEGNIESVESKLLNGIFDTYRNDVKIEEYEEEKEPELEDDGDFFVLKLEGTIEELKMEKFNERYAKEEKENIQDVEDETEMNGEESKNFKSVVNSNDTIMKRNLMRKKK